MNLFRKAGEKFEETKQMFKEGMESKARCQSCDEPVDEGEEYCPDCAEGAVESAG